MLTPEYLQGCTVDVIDMYEQLNQAITNDICRRIVKTGGITPTASWQIQMAQESGKLFNEIIAEVAACSGKAESEIWKMFKDAGIASVRYDAAILSRAGLKAPITLSPSMEQILRANANRTYTTLNNLMFTSAVQSQTQYYNAMNEAVMKVESGAFSYAEALRSAVDKCASDGAWVQYQSGARMRLESAARMNLLTAVGQTAAKITEMNGKELGCEYYETSAHAGARPTHEEWQGRVFKIEGSEPDYPNFYDETGYGEGDGLCGWNCRHSFYPFFPGLSLPAYTPDMLESYNEERYPYNGRRYTEYQASQKMRKMERDIRDAKRKVAAYDEAIRNCEDPEALKELKKGREDATAVLRKRRGKLTDFCDQTGMEKDYLRMRIPGQSVTTSGVKPPVAAPVPVPAGARSITGGVELSAAEAYANENRRVLYDPDADYSIKFTDRPDKVNEGLRQAAMDVARQGTEDGFEHMYLVDLETGSLSYAETNNDPVSVGYDFWKYAADNPDRTFAFVHNHNYVSSLSQTDIETPLLAENIPVMIAVQNDGTKYVVERVKKAPVGFFPQFDYEKDIEPLNKLAREGKITPGERAVMMEKTIIERLLEDYYGGRITRLDGR